jgi:hypothetical protein
MADSGARVPKVLPLRWAFGNTKSIASSLTALFIIAVLLEPFGSAAMSNDVEEPQELAVEPPAGGDDAGQEGGLRIWAFSIVRDQYG